MKVITGKQNKNYSAVIYGPPGIGKSTLASLATDAIFVDLEGGLGQINCARVPVEDGKEETFIRKWKTAKDAPVRGAWNAITAAALTDYKTIVIDTISAAEDLLTQYILESADLNPKNHTTLAEYGYNKGFAILGEQWSSFMRLLKTIQTQCQKNIILVGHSAVRRVDDPTTESYDRFEIAVHKLCSSALINSVDAVLFARNEVFTKSKEVTDKRMGIGTGQRELYCIEKPAYLAKNRFGIPEKIKMSPAIFPIMEGLRKPPPLEEKR